MVIKLLFFFTIAFVVSYYVQGAPGPFRSEKEFETKLAEFLAQDKEVQRALHSEEMSGTGRVGLLRFRRQTEVDGMRVDNDGSVDEDGQGGFFDRAAKFIMDLLQRFLKWVNTDSN